MAILLSASDGVQQEILITSNKVADVNVKERGEWMVHPPKRCIGSCKKAWIGQRALLILSNSKCVPS